MTTIVVFLLNAITQSLVTLLSLSLASHHLNPAEFAAWALGNAAFGYVSLFDLGASVVVQRNQASERPALQADARTMAKGLFVVLTAAGLVAFSIGMASTVPIYVGMLGAMLVRVGGNVLGTSAIADGAFVAERAGRMFASATLLCSQFVFLRAGLGLSSLALSVLLAATVYLGSLLIASRLVVRIIVNERVDLRVFLRYRDDHLNWIFYTLPALFIYNFQIFALKIWSSVEAVAAFSAAHQLYYGTISVALITTTLSAAVISRRHHIPDVDKRNEAILANLATNSSLVSLGLILVSVLLAPVGGLLFPDISLEKYWSVFVAYGLLLVLEAAQNAATNALINTGHTNFKAINIASAVLNVVGCYLFVPLWGVGGAILSVALAQSLTCIFFNIRRAILLLQLPSQRVIAPIATNVAVYGLIVGAHWWAYQAEDRIRLAADTALVLGVFLYGAIRVLPGVLSIISEYRRSSVPQGREPPNAQ